jgi:hypothetical protein
MHAHKHTHNQEHLHVECQGAENANGNRVLRYGLHFSNIAIFTIAVNGNLGGNWLHTHLHTSPKSVITSFKILRWKNYINFSTIPRVLYALPILFFSIIDQNNKGLFAEKCKLWSSSMCNYLHFPATSSLLNPNILLITLFSNTFSLCSSQVSHSSKVINQYRYDEWHVIRES